VRSCHRQIQVKTGSVIEGSHLTYSQFILFVYSWSKGNTTDPASMFQELGFGIRTKVAAYWNDKLREVCAQYFQVNKEAADDKEAVKDFHMTKKDKKENKEDTEPTTEVKEPSKSTAKKSRKTSSKDNRKDNGNSDDPKLRLDLHFSEFLWRRTHTNKDLFMQILHDIAEFNPLKT